MTKSPSVVIMNQFTPSYNNLNLDYKSKKQVYNSAMNMFYYYSDNKKKAFFMLDYFSGKIGKDKEMNIIFEDGKYATKEEIEKRKLEYTKYIEKSNLYKLVISFPKGFLEENVDIKDFEQALAKTIIPDFLHKCGFIDIDKMSYQFSLHTNTDNLHFHFSFAEKEPNYRYKNNKRSYRFKGELTEEELNYFKNEILHYIEKEKIYTPLLKETNQEIEKLKSYFNPKDRNYLLNDKDNILLEDKIMRLGKLLNEKRNTTQRIKFNSIKDKEIISLTKDIKKNIFKINNKKLNNDYELFLSDLSRINNYFDSLSIDNNINLKDYTLTKNKKEYLNNYIYNSIVNHAIYTYKYHGNKKISENELLQEIIYKNYKASRRYSKYNILTSYLKGNKFRYKKEINQAVKNINDELEDAEKEFSKLFEDDKHYE